MTLTDLLWAYQNQIYRQSHTYNLPQKKFEKFLTKVEIIEQKSQALVKVFVTKEFHAKGLKTSSVEVLSKGVWVCTEGTNGWLTFCNYNSKFQAEMVVKGKGDSFIVQQTIPRPLMDKYDYQRERYIAADLIKKEYLKSYSEDEGYVRQKDIVLVLNDYLRQQSFSARNTRLVQAQPKSFDRVIEIIKKMRTDGLLVKCEKYLSQRRVPYGMD